MNPREVSENSPPSAIDFDELTSRCMGRLDLVDRVLEQFQQSLEGELRGLQEAMEQSDWDEVSRAAHRIKGTASTVAAHGLRQCAELLQQSASGDQFEGAGEQITEIRRECSRLSQLIANR